MFSFYPFMKTIERGVLGLKGGVTHEYSIMIWSYD